MKVNLFILFLLFTLNCSQVILYTDRYPSKKYPLTINSSSGTILIADPISLNTFQLSNGFNSRLTNHGVSYEQSSNFILLNNKYYLLKTIGGSFDIYAFTTSSATKISNPSSFNHDYTNEQISLFTLNSKGIVAFISSGFLTFIQFDSNEDVYKQYSTRIVGKNVHCISFALHFSCFYTGALNECLMHSFDANLDQVDFEKNLQFYNCDKSLGGKLFLFNQNNFFICSLKDDKSVNCLVGTNNAGILTFFNSRLIVSGCSSSFISFGISSFKADYIVFCSNGNQMIMQQINIALELLNPVIKFYEPTGTDIIMPSVNPLGSTNAVLFYSDSNKALVYTMLISPTCNSFSASAFTNGLINIDFASKISNSGYTKISVIFKTKPSSGSIVLMPGELPTFLDTPYDLLKLSYKASNTDGTVTVDFIGINSTQFISLICSLTITIQKCYISCFSCNSAGNNLAHYCIACATGYYPIQHFQNNCANDLTKPQNYYFEVNIYKPCDVSCGKCKGGTVNDCTTCATGYHWANLTKTSCLNSLPPKHYLDSVIDTYLPCYKSCGSCTQGGTTLVHNCVTCIASTSYPIDNFPGNCVDENTKPLNYYLDASTIYKECYISCGSCLRAGISTDQKCNSCKGGYYMLNSDSSFCYNDLTKPRNTYFDSVSKTYKECHTTCETCIGGLNGRNENCLTCQANKYLHYTNCVAKCPSPTFGIHDKCVNTCPHYSIPNIVTNTCNTCPPNFLYKKTCVSPQPDGTYIANALYNILDDCYPSCEKCLKRGEKEEMNCTKCQINYFQLEDRKSQCHNVLPDGYYIPSPALNPLQYNKCYDTCKTCSNKGSSITQNCLTCIQGYEINPKQLTNCVKSCASEGSYWYANDLNEFHCTNSKVCPDKYPFYEPSSNECALSCLKCVKCAIIPYYTYGNICVPICPDNSIKDSQVLKCHDLSDPDALLSSLPRYIISKPSNKVLVNNNIQFQFCNTTTTGWADCIESASKMSLSIVDFKKCFESLTIGHQLPPTNIFYIGIFNIMTDYSTPQVEYVVYDSLGGKLDLTYCSNDWIKINKSIDIAKDNSLLLVDKISKENGYNILDSNSTFYHNICSTYTSEFKTDVTLADRAKYIYPQNPLCEENCLYGTLFYDLIESRIECICKTKGTTDLNTKDNFVGNEFKNKTLDQPLQFFKCYNLVMNIGVFKNNIGNYFMLIFFVFQLIFCIWFCVQGKKPLLSFMHSQLLQSNIPINPDLPKPSPPKTVNDVLNEMKKEKEKERKDERKMCDEYAKVFMINQNYVEKEDEYNINIGNSPIYNANNGDNNNSDKGNDEGMSSRKKSNYYDDENEENTQTKNTFSNIKKYSHNKYLADLKKAEVNEYQVFNEKLKKYDLKSFYFIYCYNLKKRHRLLAIILLKNIYEITPYKLSMLILSILFDMFFNTLFCYNGYISYLFVNQTRINVALCFGFGFCSAILSYCIMRFLEHIMEYKPQFRKLAAEQNKDKDYYREMNKCIRNLNVKFGFFYFIAVLIQIFMWYFITVFCATFSNTQYTWGIGIVVSLIFSWCIPFLFYFIFTAILYRGIKRKSM